MVMVECPARSHLYTLQLLSPIAPAVEIALFLIPTPEPLNSRPAVFGSIEYHSGRNSFALEAYRQGMSLVSFA
jgi:hypothetical protein